MRFLNWLKNIFNDDPKFKAGDDIVWEHAEPWEPKVARIMEVGVKKYRYRFYTNDHLNRWDQSNYISQVDSIYEIYTPPKEPK